MKNGNIILIGFMATGKTTIGKKLASYLELDFIDTDEIIVQNEGMKISRVFSLKGEAYFRDQEEKALEGLMGVKGKVIATGGGIIKRKINCDRIKKLGVVVCLEAEIDWIIGNLKNSKEIRPLVQDGNPSVKVESLIQERRNSYLHTSHYVVDTTNKTIDAVTQEIIEIIEGGTH